MDRRSSEVLFALLITAHVAAISGCRLAPSRRGKAAPGESPPSATDVIPPLPIIPQPAPPPLTPVSQVEAPPAPLLDAAFAKDEAIRRVSLEAAEAPKPEPSAGPPPPTNVPETSSPPVSPPTTNNPPPPPPEMRKPTDTTPVEPEKGVEAPKTPVDPPMPIPEAITRPDPVLPPKPPDSGSEASASEDGPLGGVKRLIATMAETMPPAEASEPRIESPPAAAEPAVEAFAVADLKICRQVNGLGQYSAIDPAALEPGQPFLLYAAIDGLKSEGIGPSKTRVALTVEVIAEGRTQPSWSLTLRDDRPYPSPPPRVGFLNCRLAVPRNLPRGPYRLRLVVRDEIASRDAESSLAFSIHR